MARLTITRETKAARCEICHQTDLFDPVNNTCARCANLDSAIALNPDNNPHFQLDANNQARQVVIPENVTIEDLGDTFTIAYQSGSLRNLFLIVLVCFNTINFLLRQFHDGPSSHLFILIKIIVACTLVLAMINALIKKTFLTITTDQIIKRDWPNIGFTNHTINIDQIANFEMTRFNDWDRLSLLLKNGKKIRLLKNRGDRAAMEFVERVLNERLAKRK